MHGHEFWGGFGFWWIFPLVMMVFCFFFMRGWCGRWMWGTDTDIGYGESAMDILQKRYARGEIDQKEYEEKKKILEGLNN